MQVEPQGAWCSFNMECFKAHIFLQVWPFLFIQSGIMGVIQSFYLSISCTIVEQE